jgi:hypothetical protein
MGHGALCAEWAFLTSKVSIVAVVGTWGTVTSIGENEKAGELRVEVSHPFVGKKTKGWGTGLCALNGLL